MTTISKVAELAGVSRTTVSHVINHADRVSLPLRERVEAAIAQLGFVPNPQAQSLRTGRTNLVAMFIPDIRNPFYPELVRTAQIEFEAAGLVVRHNFDGGHAVFELADSGHHDHMVCVDTGDVIEFFDQEIEKLQKEIVKRHGYELVDHNLVLYVRKKD